MPAGSPTNVRILANVRVHEGPTPRHFKAGQVYPIRSGKAGWAGILSPAAARKLVDEGKARYEPPIAPAETPAVADEGEEAGAGAIVIETADPAAPGSARRSDPPPAKFNPAPPTSPAGPADGRDAMLGKRRRS